jgi:glucose/arabinose dehydrogenase
LNRRGSIYLAFPAVIILLLAAGACGGGGEEGSDASPFGLTSEIVAPGANVDAIVFAPDGRIFFAEHWTGAIRVIGADGALAPEAWATVPNLSANLFWGLTGLALDPEFETNGYVYALYTELISSGTPPIGKPVLVRFTDQAGVGTNMQVIVDDLPEADGSHPYNANGSIHFGPDGFLYLTLGDYDRRLETGPSGEQLPQDLGSPIGKILRLNKEDGSAPADNPFVGQPGADARIFAYGFRNPFNFAFHPDSGALFGSDNGGRTCEEINIVEAGADYGWPRTEETPFDCQATEQQLPIHWLAKEGMEPSDVDSVVGVAGMDFITSDVYPMLADSLVICEGGPRSLRRLVLASPGLDQVTEDDEIAQDCYAVSTSPDGIIYYSNVYEIRRLMPPAETASPSP